MNRRCWATQIAKVVIPKGSINLHRGAKFAEYANIGPAVAMINSGMVILL